MSHGEKDVGSSVWLVLGHSHRDLGEKDVGSSVWLVLGHSHRDLGEKDVGSPVWLMLRHWHRGKEKCVSGMGKERQRSMGNTRNFVRWIIMVIGFMALSAAVVCGFNVLTDPFGVFGDRVLDWYAYDMTNNPRVAKIAYLDKHHEEYDSYIIGCSKTSSFSTELLNEYYGGARFYNMIMYGGDMYDIKATADYILDNYKPRNIIIALGLEETVNYNSTEDEIKNSLHAKTENDPLLPFYGKYLLLNPQYGLDKLGAMANISYLPGAVNVFDPVTGVYNKAKRDAERISGMEDFALANPDFEYDLTDKRMSYVADVAEDVRELRGRCAEEGVDFKLVMVPLYYKEVDNYRLEELAEYWDAMAETGAFWDFSGYSPISFDERYFYDAYHFRNAVGDMVLAEMFGDESVYVPEGFGRLVTRENVDRAVSEGFSERRAPDISGYTKDVPVLLYHDLAVAEGGGASITPQRFRKDMEDLAAAGYTAVFFRDAEDYVFRGKVLPERPVLITFDDGYRSNIFPGKEILAETGMRATVNVIGVSVGKDVYKDTDQKIIPHFSYAEGKTAFLEGLMDFQSHSYAMHDSKDLEPAASFREGVLPKRGEGERAYIEAFRADVLKSKQGIEDAVGNRVSVYAYPLGFYSVLTESLLRDMGFSVTLSIEPGVNTLVKGLPQSLLAMRRINVTMDLPAMAELIADW